jgi:glucose-6-phosphate 1-dehydrogenase
MVQAAVSTEPVVEGRENPLREGLRVRRTPEPCAMVIFGASGDLTERKLFPALYSLWHEHLLPSGFSVIGWAITPYTDEQFRDHMKEGLSKYLDLPEDHSPFLESFHDGVFYISDDFANPAAYERLKQLLEKLDSERGASGNRLFYLATPPSFFPVIVQQLGKAGLATPKRPGHAWTRIIIEKPFGRDLKSARELNHVVTEVFDESQVYRIDHYLGKETVQNLLVFRFANGIFEPIWNQRFIDHVQIAVAEELGVENRGAYYEEAGLVRDMIQNHVLQVMSLIAMEPPARFEANSVRDEKIKVLRAIRSIPADRLQEFAVRGQYVEGWAEGRVVPAYRAEPKVSAQSTTETYAALKLYVDNWRWAGVPFYLRSGKRLPKRITEISIEFRRVPHVMFAGTLIQGIEPNLLSVRIQPNEGISLKISSKVPSTVMQIRPVRMEFRYGESFGAVTETAYETLLLDCMLGDTMLFNRADAVEVAWALIDPVLDRWKKDGQEGLAFYETGSWGPQQADEFIRRDGREWIRL